MKRLVVVSLVGVAIANLCGSALMLQDAKNSFIVATEFPSVQAALDESGKRGGGIVFIPAGTYEIQRTLKVPSNVTLMGAGSTTILKATAQIGENQFPDNRVIQNADPHGGNVGIVIKDLVVDGGLLGEYHKTGIYGICLSNCDASRIEGVIVRRCSGEGILVSYGKGQIIVERCIVEENNCGINVHHRIGEVLVRDNICRRNGVHKPQYGGIGIFVEAVSNISIVGNVCTENAWAGIVWMGGADEARGIKYPASDALIANNVCNGNGSQGGIFINGTYSETNRFLVTGNICKRNGRDGIWAFKAKDGVIANNLCVSNNRPFGEKGELAEWQRSASGIRLVECQNVVVTGNRCLDEREEKWQVFGICVEGQSKGNIVSKNIVTENGKEGVFVCGRELGDGECEVNGQNVCLPRKKDRNASTANFSVFKRVLRKYVMAKKFGRMMRKTEKMR